MLRGHGGVCRVQILNEKANLTNNMKTINMNFKGMVLTALISLGSMTAAAGEPANYNVVPLPQSIVMTKGAAFEVDADVQILAPAELQSEAEFLKQYIKELTKCDLTIVNKRAKRCATSSWPYRQRLLPRRAM